MWQEALAPHVEAGRLVAVGVVQEQHPDRARLYAQYRELDWPVFVDALNVLGHEVVPIPIGIDAAGRVLYPRMEPEDLDGFLAASESDAEVELPRVAPHPLAGDVPFLRGQVDDAVALYRAAVAERAGDGVAQFRLGVALRRRFESAQRRPGDGQGAIEAWTGALALVPDQYIWRRRIQQYGPRLDKPYNMYGWVEEARAAIRARGETPVPLAVEPRGTETQGRGPVPTIQLTDPDPEGRVPRDEAGLVEIAPIVAPARVRPGHRVRVRFVLRVREAFWNNEAEPVALHVDPPEGLALMEGALSYPIPDEAETQEDRILEVEIEVREDVAPGPRTVPAYALYSVCEEKAGVCRLVRQDVGVRVVVDPEAPSIR